MSNTPEYDKLLKWIENEMSKGLLDIKISKFVDIIRINDDYIRQREIEQEELCKEIYDMLTAEKVEDPEFF